MKTIQDETKIELTEQKKDRWYRKRWVRVTAICLVAVLIISEIIIHYTSNITPIAALAPESLMEAQIQDVMTNPLEVMEAIRQAERETKRQQKKLLEACEEAETLIAEGKYEEAIEPVDYITRNMELTEEETQQMKMTRTALTFASGQFEEAREGCTELIEQGKDSNGYYYFMRSVCDIQEEKYDTARDDLLAALEHDYEDPALCYIHLAFCENYLGNYENVLEYAQEARALGVEEVYTQTLVYLQAVASLQTEQFDRTITYITELLETEEYKETGELYYFRGVSELTLEKYQEAYDDFNLAMKYGIVSSDSNISEEETVTMLYYNRGIAALALNKLEEARSDLEKVTERGADKEMLDASGELLEMLQSIPEGTEVQLKESGNNSYDEQV